MGNRIATWRELVAGGLVLVLLGLFLLEQTQGTVLVIGIVCLVAGAVWRVLSGPDRTD